MNNADILLNPDNVVNKTAAKSSLSDMYDMHVFRDAFIEREKQVHVQNLQTRTDIEKLVLSSDMVDNSCLECTTCVLCCDTERFVKDIYHTKSKNQLTSWLLCIILGICVLCVAILVDDHIKDKRLKGMKNEDYDYS